MGQNKIEVIEKKNGKWEIKINEESTNKEYISEHNALYWAVRKADQIGQNIVHGQGFTHMINKGDII